MELLRGYYQMTLVDSQPGHILGERYRFDLELVFSVV